MKETPNSSNLTDVNIPFINKILANTNLLMQHKHLKKKKKAPEPGPVSKHSKSARRMLL